MNFQSFQNNVQDTKVGRNETGCLSSSEKKLSLGSLITWNITKVLEACPFIDLKDALQSTQCRMERDSRDGAPMLCLMPEEQHLAGAVLAWHRLGHGRADSLYEFIKSNMNKYKVESVSSINVVNRSVSKIRSCFTSSSSFGVKSITGPVVRLPALETKIVMRVENNYQCQFDNKSLKSKQNDKPGQNNGEEKTKRAKSEVKKKVKAACMDFSIDREHLPKLAELEEVISDFRTRAANISRRKAERIELLERADFAWKDLEFGYERRLKLLEEKGKDTEDQIKIILEERNGHKAKCMTLVEDLRKRSAEAEVMREQLTDMDKKVCGLACERLQLNELGAKDDAAVAAEHCHLTQIDRELEFKEQAERRKIQYLESEISTTRGLTIEAERAIRSDITSVQENFKQITNEIDKEKCENEPLKAKIIDLQTQKIALAREFDNCQIKCDEGMHRKIDLLKSKKKELAALKEKVTGYQCKIPIDASTEAKRTPSLVANCSCETDDNAKSCSCTSLRLMSDLLGRLFEGLMSDLYATGSLMPCQLLKCLDDGHDWERDSILRTNIHSYCSQLLIGELNIAITTTVEYNHTKWLVGCGANRGNLKNGVGEHDLDDRAKKLAAELAEQMFQRKADDVTRQALQIVSSRVQPCHCNKEGNQAPAAYPLLVKPQTTRKINDSLNLKRTINDVAQLREQIEILKKETIGKENLKFMEDKLKKIINRASTSKSKSKNRNKHVPQIHINDDKPERDGDAEPVRNRDTIILEKLEFPDVKNIFSLKPKAIPMKPKTNQNFKNIRLPSAVGVYICDTQQVSHNVTNVFKTSKKYKGNNPTISNIDKLMKCTCAYKSYSNDTNDILVKEQGQKKCPKECICFHKIPSNTSINEFLESLTKTESQKHHISLETKKGNSKNSKCLLDEGARPTILEYMCVTCLNKENENSCNVEFLNSDISDCPESNLVKTCNESENISLGELKLNLNEKNKYEFKKYLNINEYGTPIKDCCRSKEFKEGSISTAGSTPNSCVCCNDENLNTRELEINALNLLKEHIKDKIKDLKPNFQYPNTTEEEKNIYDNILNEIKNILTDGSFNLFFKCSFENHEGSRQRAYNLLKEYLKIKIKKAKCSCTTRYDHSDNFLPTILDKITELIENDFKRLKLKYREEFISKKCSRDLKKTEKELKNIKINDNQSVLLNELGEYYESVCGQKKALKDIDNIMLDQESSNLNSQNKPFDAIHRVQNVFNTDKKTSCNTLNPDIYFNTNPIDEYVETFYTRSKQKKDNNKSAQVSFYFNSQSKSSDAIQNIGENNNIDKKVSCTLGNDIYLTDCNCRYIVESNSKDTRSDTDVLYFDINDNFFGLN